MDHRKYVPVLKWKMGEYQALSRLEDNIKARVVPLIEIPPPGYDFESQQLKKTNEEHLKDFGKRLSSKWGNRSCFVDLLNFDNAVRIAKQHCITHIFEQTVEHGCNAIPVLNAGSTESCLKAAAKIPSIEKVGLAIRLSGDDFDDPKLGTKLTHISNTVGVSWGEVDVVVDLGTPDYSPKTVFRGGLNERLKAIPQSAKARSVIIVGSSFPESLQAYKDENFIPRREFTGYTDFVNFLDDSARVPTFGDYSAAHPSIVELDMRLIKPYAKLRYTLTDKWYIAIGRAVRTAGFEQYRDMCQALIDEDFFDGGDFSAGDKYIEDCANGDVPTGNLSTWVWVATNRHITKTVVDLASFHGFSNKL
jgi:Beta protein